MPQDFTPLVIIALVAGLGALALLLFSVASSRIGRPRRYSRRYR